eukprot:TRINITY_DN2228_c0_g1_i3.p1 TRINITY_DN2228_c0_g1~~TRINITY_DN2228_c0_g1_i3.p1  ORF type:complete len:351 (+),score=63.11 TRINITY_DN2228_c0_g1_i3:1212-2264(+)
MPTPAPVISMPTPTPAISNVSKTPTSPVLCVDTTASLSFQVVGIVVMVITSSLVEHYKGPDEKKGYSISSLIWGLASLLLPIVSGCFLREKVRTEEEIAFNQSLSWKENVLDLFNTFKSKNFVCLICMYGICWTCAQLVQNNFFLYVKYVLGQETHFVYFVLSILCSVAPAAFLWGRLTISFGKRNTYLVGASIWVVVMLGPMFLSTSTPLWALYLQSIIVGISIGVAFLLPWSMLPDIILENECNKGVRSEGAFYSIFILLQKFGVALALGGSSWILGLAGYDGGQPSEPPPETQPESVILALKIMQGPLGSGMIFLSMIPMFFYTLEKETVTKLRRKILERNCEHTEE